MRIQIHIAIITYCLIGIIEHDLKLNRPIIEVMRILASSLLTKDKLKEQFFHNDNKKENDEDCGQLKIEFN